MERKITRGELKAVGEEGQFRAVIATFNRVDHDMDVTLPGAFPEGKVVPISAYGHTSWNGALPVGKGTIHQDEEKAWIEGRFFLDTTAGRETYNTVKGLTDETGGGAAGQEWSYGYDATKSDAGEFEEGDITYEVRFLKEVDVHEASPVLLGAGIGTGIMDIKSRSFADEGEAALAVVESFTERAQSLADLRRKDGRDLSDTNRERLEAIGGSLKDAAVAIESLLSVQEKTEEEPASESEERVSVVPSLAAYARERAESIGGIDS